MDILRNLRRLESDLTRRIDLATHRLTASTPGEPLEILHAIVDIVEGRIEPAGRGTYVFPFHRISVRIAADSAEKRARLEAVLESPPSLPDRIKERLESFGCAWGKVDIRIDYAESDEPHWTTRHFDVQFERLADPPRVVSTDTAREILKLSVIRGVAEKSDYSFTDPCINLGRCPEVRDDRNRLIRTNHVVFSENAAEANLSVSRNHAHISCTEEQAYRLFDDQSAQGTSIVRNGRTIPVPPGSRGVRLQTGDDVILGDACLRVDIKSSQE